MNEQSEASVTIGNVVLQYCGQLEHLDFYKFEIDKGKFTAVMKMLFQDFALMNG